MLYSINDSRSKSLQFNWSWEHILAIDSIPTSPLLTYQKPPIMHYLDPHNSAFAAAIANEPAPHHLGVVRGREALETLQKHERAPDILTESFEVPREMRSNKCDDSQAQVPSHEAAPYDLLHSWWWLGPWQVKHRSLVA